MTELILPVIREATPEDTNACIALRGNTRENAMSAGQLEAIGITVETWSQATASGEIVGYVAEHLGNLQGFCFGHLASGEILVLAIHPEAEGHGLGKALLRRVTECLQRQGHHRLHLSCNPDPGSRSYGFYRHEGWRSAGVFDANGDEVLELHLVSP